MHAQIWPLIREVYNCRYSSDSILDLGAEYSNGQIVAMLFISDERISYSKDDKIQWEIHTQALTNARLEKNKIIFDYVGQPKQGAAIAIFNDLSVAKDIYAKVKNAIPFAKSP